jgi:uroporphyrinogen-III decarboxylase
MDQELIGRLWAHSRDVDAENDRRAREGGFDSARDMFRSDLPTNMPAMLFFTGDTRDLFLSFHPDLIEIGLDCYQTFQPEIYDIEKVKSEYGADLSFWGGISTQRLLPYATPDEDRRETARIMRIMGKGGGYIASPTHSVPGDVPPENILAMCDVFLHQDRYL